MIGRPLRGPWRLVPSPLRRRRFLTGPLHRRWRLVRQNGERANAIIEFVFVAVLVLVPLIYLIVAVAVVQRSRLATTNAARDVGRAIATAGTAGQAEARAQAALQIALHSQGLRPADVELRYIDPAADCRTGSTITPSLAPASVRRSAGARDRSAPRRRIHALLATAGAA